MGEVRICVGMRKTNESAKREKHIMPTTSVSMFDLNGEARFTCTDLRRGYHLLMPDEKSRQITTFSTHLGI